jgi:hypothetical protein
MFAALVLAVSAAGGTVIGAAITAVLALGGAIYLNHVERRREDLNRRRDRYSEAYPTAMEWCEGVYRVRRRAPDGSEDRELVKRFHDLQERIAYYQGWLCIEAADLGRSYQDFLGKVVAECKASTAKCLMRQGASRCTSDKHQGRIMVASRGLVDASRQPSAGESDGGLRGRRLESRPCRDLVTATARSRCDRPYSRWIRGLRTRDPSP